MRTAGDAAGSGARSESKPKPESVASEPEADEPHTQRSPGGVGVVGLGVRVSAVLGRRGSWPRSVLFASAVCGVRTVARDWEHCADSQAPSRQHEELVLALSSWSQLPSPGAASPNPWAHPTSRPQVPRERSSLEGAGPSLVKGTALAGRLS